MTSFIDNDIAFMCADVLSVPVVFGNQNTSGFLDEMELIDNDDQLGPTQIRATVLTIQTGSLTGLAEDSAITVDGKAYVVREPARTEDGKLTQVRIAAAGVHP